MIIIGRVESGEAPAPFDSQGARPGLCCWCCGPTTMRRVTGSLGAASDTKFRVRCRSFQARRRVVSTGWPERSSNGFAGSPDLPPAAAFRLRDTGAYPTYYGFEHTHPELVERAVYGLPEIHRDELRGARLIATPGCYVTAAVLALRPLVASGLIRDRGIIVDAASGVTGAGRRSEHAYS